MVIVAGVTPLARFGSEANIVEVAADAGPGVKTTVSPVLMTGAEILTVLDSALVERKVQVDTPRVFVAEQVSNELFDPVEVNVGTIPTTGALLESFKEIITFEVATLLAITGPVAVIDEFAATADPLWKITVPPDLEIGVSMLNVFVSGVVEARVQRDSPAEDELEHAPYTFNVPVAENVGVIPDTSLLKASFKVIVIVEVEVPSGFTGLVPEIVELAAKAAPAIN